MEPNLIIEIILEIDKLSEKEKDLDKIMLEVIANRELNISIEDLESEIIEYLEGTSSQELIDLIEKCPNIMFSIILKALILYCSTDDLFDILDKIIKKHPIKNINELIITIYEQGDINTFIYFCERYSNIININELLKYLIELKDINALIVLFSFCESIPYETCKNIILENGFSIDLIKYAMNSPTADINDCIQTVVNDDSFIELVKQSWNRIYYDLLIYLNTEAILIPYGADDLQTYKRVMIKKTLIEYEEAILDPNFLSKQTLN